ncbi:hypothetical protein DVH24_013149 [Malus domestica]|uniref:Uncharacterized protein n=1 Tax=Malus domestica TaxID=3750 RepID=A0A498INX4_MALDO|nr:hypothetical protein DVH24_013149 [Malus domestica]
MYGGCICLLFERNSDRERRERVNYMLAHPYPVEPKTEIEGWLIFVDSVYYVWTTIFDLDLKVFCSSSLVHFSFKISCICLTAWFFVPRTSSSRPKLILLIPKLSPLYLTKQCYNSHKNGYNLSTPKTEKFSKDCENGCVRYGLSSMQGWRTTMEDAIENEYGTIGQAFGAVASFSQETEHFLQPHFL